MPSVLAHLTRGRRRARGAVTRRVFVCPDDWTYHVYDFAAGAERLAMDMAHQFAQQSNHVVVFEPLGNPHRDNWRQIAKLGADEE